MEARSAWAPPSREPRVEDVPQRVPEQVEPEDRHQDREAREVHQPGRPGEVDASAREERAPLRERRLGPEAEERQPGRDQERLRELERRQHDQRGRDVAEDVARRHPPGRGAERPGGEHELARPHLLDPRPHHPDEHRHAPDPDRDHGVLEARAERRHDGERQQEPREREHHVDQRADRQVRAAPAQARRQPERRPHEPTDADADQADPEADAAPVDDPGQEVAAELVRPERVRRRRRPEPAGDRHPVGVDRVERRPERRHPQEEERDRAADPPRPRAREARQRRPPRARPVAGHPVAVRGSSHPPRRSTAALSATYVTATVTTTPWISGKSRVWMAMTASSPTPCQANTTSTMNAPESMNPNWSPMTERTGPSAARSACLATTTWPGRPLAQAVRMNSWPSVSRSVERTSRAIAAAERSPSVSAGSTRCRADSAPMTGKSPHRTLSRLIRRSPSQKGGIEMPTTASAVATASSSRSRWRAAATPSPSPSVAATSRLATARSRVSGYRSRRSSRTGRPFWMGRPRSPRTRRARYSAYWTVTGRSQPSSWRTRSMVARSADCPMNMISTGSPGTRTRIEKTRSVMTGTMTRSVTSRRRTNRAIGSR